MWVVFCGSFQEVHQHPDFSSGYLVELYFLSFFDGSVEHVIFFNQLGKSGSRMHYIQAKAFEF